MSDRPISLAETVTISPEVVFKELGGEGVLLDLASGIYFGLDETSTRLWLLLQANGSLRRVFDEMIEEFDVDPDRLERDLLQFVADLTRRNLASLASNSPPTLT
jgi:coenzyme PQQ synthesis protein D (PqqD)